jgi:hypothetical protein
LTAVVERAQTITNASGAALALATDHAQEIECCARSGRTAPPLGRSVLVEDSLTALCLRRGQRLLCDDVAADPRVAALLELGIRSLVLAPVRQANLIVGVLTVLADAPHAFSARHLAELEAGAREISEILSEESAGAEPAPESSPMTEPDMSKLEPVAVRLPSADGASSQDAPELQAPYARQNEEAEGEPAPTYSLPTAAAAPPRRLVNTLLVAAVALLMVAGGAIGIYLAIGQHAATGPAILPLQNAAPTGGMAANAIPSGERPTLRINPDPVVATLGQTVVLNGLFSRGQDISSVAIQIDYDPNLLQFMGVSEGGFLGKDGQQVVLAQRDDPLTGILKISAQRPPGSPGISGDGPVFALSFQGRKKGVCTVSISSGALDSQGRRVEVVGSSASVTVD